MKYHRPVLSHVIYALSHIFGLTEEARRYHADKVIERVFKANRQLGSRDRRFIAEAIYEIVRWWRLLRFAIDRDTGSVEGRDLWLILGAYLVRVGEPLPDWPEFSELQANDIRARLEMARRYPAIRESVPDWLYDLGCEQMGAESWQQMLQALNRPAPVVLRANRLKTDREELKARLADENILSSEAPQTDDGLILEERRNIFASKAFHQGLFELQDGASQQVSCLLKVEPGMRVIDACAGAGGKTLHIAALMKNRGKIIAMDVHQKKLDELRRRATRAGSDIIETRLIESGKSIKRLEAVADRVLLDVPCSGLGVLRRNPDSKWKLEPDELERLRSLQLEILTNYSRMVKPAGRLVYATCSVLPSENERQIEVFLTSPAGKMWRLIDERHFTPGADGYDGFYAAALENH